MLNFSMSHNTNTLFRGAIEFLDPFAVCDHSKPSMYFCVPLLQPHAHVHMDEDRIWFLSAYYPPILQQRECLVSSEQCHRASYLPCCTHVYPRLHIYQICLSLMNKVFTWGVWSSFLILSLSASCRAPQATRSGESDSSRLLLLLTWCYISYYVINV